MEHANFSGCASNWLLFLPDEEQLKKTQYSNKVPSTYCLHSIFIDATYLLANKLVDQNNPPSEIIFHPKKPPDCGIISTAWVFDKPIPNNIALNIKSLSAQVPNMPVHVYCGTTQCVDAVTKLNSDTNLTVEFLVASRIVKNTSLEHWFAHHPFNKVLAGREFETHLQEVVRLGLLWNYGGFYIDPTVQANDALKFILKCSELNYANALVSKIVNVSEGSVLQASFFPVKHHPFIGELAERFDSDYPTGGNTSGPMNFNFQKRVWTSLNAKLCNFCPAVADDVLLKVVPLLGETYKVNHYGTLSYNAHPCGTFNLGDEIQGFPGLQYLPFVDTFIERDNLKASSGNNKITSFFNAYWSGTRASYHYETQNSCVCVCSEAHGLLPRSSWRPAQLFCAVWVEQQCLLIVQPTDCAASLFAVMGLLIY